MSFTNDERDKMQPEIKARTSLPGLALALLALQILISIGALPFLPPIVPIHWNAAGQADQYASKWVNTLLFPGLGIFIYLLLRYASAIGPRLGSHAGNIANAHVRAILQVTLLLFVLTVQLLVTVVSLGVLVDFALVMDLALSVLFIVIGNYLGKVRRNFWLGIRTPWSLTNSVVWERTHRLGGWLFVAVGLLGILCSFIPALRLWGLPVLIIAVSVFLYLYSYIYYQRQTRSGHEPLAPPFDEDN
ncbi:MAG TPA: SdpI family protein [Ktedonobacteraceae bacterium]